MMVELYSPRPWHAGFARRLIFAIAGLLAVPAPGLAQTPVPDLSQISIEDLMNLEITSASRKEQRVADVAAAVFVITHDDIVRSGMTTIPDVLRMAPGVDVAQINSNKWAVSIRGFNGLYANKLLVLIDGRSVYSRIFSGVLWDAEDVMLDDVDRIEVIRGPGAAIWGANAVNGVINIVTKAAGETQGGRVQVEGGRAGDQASVRYGGAVGAVDYRLYSQWTERGQSFVSPRVRADDASHSTTTGFRGDKTTQFNVFTLEGEFAAGQARALWPNLNPLTAAVDPIANTPSDSLGGHVLGRWTHTRGNGATWQIQSFVDIASRQEPIVNYSRQSYDVDTQYHTALGRHHDVVAGVGFRQIDETLAGHVGFALTPAEGDSSLLTAFAQDEIELFSNRLAVTLGSQVQYDSDAGGNYQPTARVMWKGLRRQRFWAATSRAVRTPSLADRGLRVDFPPVPSGTGLPQYSSALGNPAALTETLVDAEAGYRFEMGTAASIDVTGFVGDYDELLIRSASVPLVVFVPSPRILVTAIFGNHLAATTHGLEVAGHWTASAVLRFDASYSAFHLSPEVDPAFPDVIAGTEDGNAPRGQWQLRSAYSPTKSATINVALFHVGRIERLEVPAYTRADVTAEWRFARGLSATVVGQNLLDAAHMEFTGVSSLLTATEVARSASVRMRWTFR